VYNPGMHVEVWDVLLLCGAGFTAAVVDSVVGGGGLISLPALLCVGVPPTVALGTNKVAAFMSSSTSAWAFVRSGRVCWSNLVYALPVALLGSVGGAWAVRKVPSEVLRPLVVVLLLCVVLYTLFKKEWGEKNHGVKVLLSARRKAVLVAAALCLGFYDGFFGPGTGSFLLFVCLMMGMDFVGAAAHAKTLNFASNIGAVAVFVSAGLVDYTLALPMGAAMVCGAWVGTRMALNHGARYVRPLFVGMTALLVGQQAYAVVSRHFFGG
jgi:uncharacterized membrane protein YfcA